MQYQKAKDHIIIRIDREEEVVEKIKEVCQKEQVTAGIVSGIGACDQVNLGLFKPTTKEYIRKELTGDFEITSLIGNIATKDSEIYLHLHINISDEQFQALGGHLDKAMISGTGEIIIQLIDTDLDRQFSEETGLNLIRFPITRE